MTWQNVGSSKLSIPLMRFLCAMTLSSSAIGFLSSSSSCCSNSNTRNSDHQQHRHDFSSTLSSLLTSNLSRKLPLVLQVQSHITQCDDNDDDDSITTKNNNNHNNKCPEVESYHRMPLPERGHEKNGHAIFGLLLGTNMIESYDIYRRPDDDDDDDDDNNNKTSSFDNVIIAYVKFGNKVDGHPGIVHGGILSLLFDDAMGFAYEALGVTMAVTANLNVDYRSPVPAGTNVKISAQLERREGRKLFWKAQMTSIDRTVLYAEASSLYIIPRGSF